MIRSPNGNSYLISLERAGLKEKFTSQAGLVLPEWHCVPTDFTFQACEIRLCFGFTLVVWRYLRTLGLYWQADLACMIYGF